MWYMMFRLSMNIVSVSACSMASSSAYRYARRMFAQPCNRASI